ncbi:MAG: hypothetical protein Q8W51_07010 [Candidatus Palauibacterales bacterium]|nr:hypothetical protein [Candidatus Palauibacterales bacterium]MDP2529470.1 hypothetical protein [Candidatus Palauibacterales bacterium]MDP2585182.1 hypothetical protein [Candidatus Palauibacterales bacterium]
MFGAAHARTQGPSRTGRRASRLAVLGLALAAAAGGVRSASAQAVPTTALGLGYPTPPLDARAAALGGIGVGLLGGTLSVRNPADLIDFRVPVLSATTSPQSVTLRGNGLSPTHDGRSNFPVLGIAVPISGFAFGIGVGSELDQDWSLSFEDTLHAASGEFPYVDRREHNGGISSINLAAARQFGPLSVGLAYDRLVGSLRETFTRQFQAGTDSTVSPPGTVSDRAQWNYHGSRFRAGAGVQLGALARVSGVYSWTPSLTAERDSVGTTRTFDMPRWFAVGASARPFANLLLTAGGGWSGWSAADREVSGMRARDVHWGGAGLEFTGWKIGVFPLALRAGAHFTQLPFWQIGHQPLDEKAVSAGIGTQFAGDRGRLDFSLEVGKRGNAPATGTAETFRRFTLTFTLRQIPTPGFLP